MQSLHSTVLPTYLASTHAYRVECTVCGVKSFSLRISLCPWYVRTNSLHLHAESWFSHTHTEHIEKILFLIRSCTKPLYYTVAVCLLISFSVVVFFLENCYLKQFQKFWQQLTWALGTHMPDFKFQNWWYILNWKIRHASKFEVTVRKI